MGFYLILGAILILGSLAQIAWPRQVFSFLRGSEFSNPEEVQLSAGYVVWLRLGGVVGVVMGIVLIVSCFR